MTHPALRDAAPSVFWLDSPERPARRPGLSTRESADLVVVGGGYTGLWTALLAKEADPSRDVLCHGDPHAGNALRAQGIPRYRFIDPEGFRCEPEYDVGVVLRDFSRQLLAIGDLRQAQSLHEQLLREATTATGTDVLRTREWAFVERVTTGLYLRWFDDLEAARTFLDSAMLLLGRPVT